MSPSFILFGSSPPMYIIESRRRLNRPWIWSSSMRSRPLNIGFQYSGSSSGFSGRHITIATPTKSPVSNAVGPGALGTRATEPRSHLMRTATWANLRWPDMLRAGFARASSASWPGARARPLTSAAQRPVSSK